MRKRFRNLVRSGWFKAGVPRTSFYRWCSSKDSEESEYSDETAYYRYIRTWCHDTFAKDTWEARKSNSPFWKDTSGSVIIHEFIFRNEKDKTLFLLKFGS